MTALCVLLYANWVLMVARFQPNVIFWDQWEFYQPLFQDEGWWARAVQQNGPVREGLGLVVSGWILGATHWDMRYDSVWTASVLLLAAALAIRLKWKITGAIACQDAWIPMIRANLAATLSIAATVADFELPDEIEPAAVFEA